MADANSDERKPLAVRQSQSNIASDEDNDADTEAEEEKQAIFPKDENRMPISYQNEAYLSDRSSNGTNSMDDIDKLQQDEDISHSSFFLCRIALFLYAFVSILVSKNFPDADISSINLHWVAWFQLFITVNIIACGIGIGGVYLTKPQLLFVCWILCTVSLCLQGCLVIAYIFNDDNGVDFESNRRCETFFENDADGDFAKAYTPEQCYNKMKTQLLWVVIGLYVVWAVSSSFGIHIMRATEYHIEKCLLLHQRTDSDDRSIISELFSDEYQQITDDETYEIHAKKSSYDIDLDHLDHKKNK